MKNNILFAIKNLFSFPFHIFYHVFVVLFFIILIFSFMRYKLKREISKYNKKEEISIIYFGYIVVASMIYDFIFDTIHVCNKRIFSFVVSFFLILLFYNCAGVFPHLEEITKDINVCIAFAIYGFLSIHYIAILEVGYYEYMKHWMSDAIAMKKYNSSLLTFIFRFFAILINMIISILMLPLKMLEILSLLFSLTFRLFGNMFGGSIVSGLVSKMQAAGIIYQLPMTIFGVQILVLLYFSFFEGLIQAFIFTLILLNNLGAFFTHDK